MYVLVWFTKKSIDLKLSLILKEGQIFNKMLINTKLLTLLWKWRFSNLFNLEELKESGQICTQFFEKKSSGSLV